ncbi:neutral zinc metallopeptidase [Saccharopolyspora sp. 6T]|uniref:neutral zinc metallopeptidase n=1 Tax=Saccharopolyspora sp. 6T TaxID=2877238 RepID=UPI001CD3B37C|nr:neutral zinc metallopeptidase [Saccharopolyspora sp. 6T]MCA1185520.1 neutral zinc metallopeptidase [Saccharopolyspora sp. 6T]
MTQPQPPWGERPVGPPPAAQPLPPTESGGAPGPHYLPPQLPPPPQSDGQQWSRQQWNAPRPDEQQWGGPQWTGQQWNGQQWNGAPPWHRPGGHPAAPPPPPRSTPWALVLALVITALFLVGVGTISVTALTKRDTAADYPGPVHETGDGSANATTSAAPTSEATSSAPTSSTEPSTSASVDSTPARSVATLGDNPININGNGAVNTPCPLPRFATDTASQSAFYEAALPCLMEMWTPALEEANLPVRMPDVVTTDSTVTSPCGTRTWDQTAMYCPGNNTIYMTARYYADKEGRTEPGVFLGQFAHEFGHAVQSMSGINEAYTQATYEANGTSPAGLELTRRSELQATCFGGMALASFQNGGMDNDIIFAALADARGRGDEYNPQPDHGSVATNTAWVDQGFYKNRVTECNTWLADPDQVD